MAYTRKDYAGGAAETTIVGDLASGTLSISIASATGWPSGSNGPFTVVIDAGTASEEKVLVTSRSSTVLTVASSGDRGYDGTTATSHSSGATIKHVLAAKDLDEANYAVSKTVGKVSAAGDLLVGDGANSLARMAKGSASTVFGVNASSTQGYGTIATAQIADSAVTNAKLAGMTRGTVKVGNSSGVASDLALGTSGYYLKSDGTDAVWAAGATADSWTALRKSADESVTSSTTLQDDDHMTFTAANGTYYIFEFAIIYASPVGGGTPDLKLSIGESGTTSGVWEAAYVDTTGTATLAAVLTNQTTTISAGTATTKNMLFGVGGHVGAGGSFKVRWAQNTSNGNATTLYTGSYLRYRTVS